MPDDINTTTHAAKALALWDSFNDSEKHGCNFGMFPAEPMRRAEKEGYESKRLVNALMALASLHSKKKAAGHRAAKAAGKALEQAHPLGYRSTNSKP